jgi:quercetin dioxygenase-like cupin family protein
MRRMKLGAKPYFNGAAALLFAAAIAQSASALADGAAQRAAAQAAEASTGQPAVDMDGEPSHHQALKNDYVRVFKVAAAPHASTLLHRHERDYVYVVLGDAEITNAVAGRPEVRVKFKDGEVHFSRGGFVHVVRNESDEPFRNVTIELLQPQGEAHNLCEQVVAGQALACTPTSEPGGIGASHTDRPLFDTDETRVILTEVAPSGRVRIRDHRWEELIVAVDDAQMNEPGGHSTELRPGDILWIARGASREIVNGGKSRARFVTLEFEPQGASAPRQ